MRAVIQRVASAEVRADGTLVGSIGRGLLVLLGVCNDDDHRDTLYLANKVLNLRIFEDPEEKMNLSIRDIRGELLVVSQFTIFGDCRKGNRPSFVEAAPPELANRLYEDLLEALRTSGVPVSYGRFGANMEISLINQGPVTILLDSRKQF